MAPKVSIIVPVFNVEKYIERCAISLFEQTFNEIEYIFVDDCSQDNSIELLIKVIDSYENRKLSTKIINHKRNRGLAAARNSGLNIATGMYILNIDSDDYVELNMVEIMFKKAIENQSDIVICDFIFQWNKVSKIAPQGYSSDSRNYTKMLLSGAVQPGIVNKMILRTLYNLNGIISVEGIDMGEDYVLTCRLAYYAKRVSKVELPLYHYVQTNENSYTKNYSQKSLLSLLKGLKVLTEFFDEKGDKEFFHNALLEGKLRKKIILLEHSPIKMQKTIANLYPETNSIISSTNLKLSERITLLLGLKKSFILLNCFLFLNNTLLETVQVLKGRRFA